MGKEEELPEIPKLDLLHTLIDDSDAIKSMDMVLEGIEKHGLEGAEIILREFAEEMGRDQIIDCPCGKERYAFVEIKSLFECLYRCPCGKEEII